MPVVNDTLNVVAGRDMANTQGFLPPLFELGNRLRALAHDLNFLSRRWLWVVGDRFVESGCLFDNGQEREAKNWTGFKRRRG